MLFYSITLYKKKSHTNEEDIIDHHGFSFSYVHQNNDEIYYGFPPTSSQIPPTSGSSDRLEWDPHRGYIRELYTSKVVHYSAVHEIIIVTGGECYQQGLQALS